MKHEHKFASGIRLVVRLDGQQHPMPKFLLTWPVFKKICIANWASSNVHFSEASNLIGRLRTLWAASATCCAAVLTGTKRMEGRRTTSQTAQIEKAVDRPQQMVRRNMRIEREVVK